MDNTGTLAGGQLRSLIERIERLEEEKQTIATDIREVYAEAKANGFDTKTIRHVVKLRKQDAAERAEQEAILDLYLQALGMKPAADVDPTPLEEAIERMGKPVPLTEEEKAEGVILAVEGRDGTRMSLSPGR